MYFKMNNLNKIKGIITPFPCYIIEDGEQIHIYGAILGIEEMIKGNFPYKDNKDYWEKIEKVRSYRNAPMSLSSYIEIMFKELYGIESKIRFTQCHNLYYGDRDFFTKLPRRIHNNLKNVKEDKIKEIAVHTIDARLLGGIYNWTGMANRVYILATDQINSL